MQKTNILILTLLAIIQSTSISAFADVTEYQSPNMNTEESSAECEVIYKTTYDFSEEIPKYPDLEVYASGYEDVYDGNSHGIIVNCKIEGVTITYSTDGKNYVSKKPVYTDVGTYVTYYKVEKDGYAAVNGSEIVKIIEAAINYSSADYSGLYDGKLHSIDLSVNTKGCQILYSEDGVNYSSKKPEYKEPGTYVVYYKILRDNYATVIGCNSVIIGNNTIDYTSNDYVGTYDGKLHGITVSVSTDRCEILYSEDGINYSFKKPEYKEPGTYVVYYKILRDNYVTVTGSNTVTIKKLKDNSNKNQNNEGQNSNNQSDSQHSRNSNIDGNVDSNISKVQTGDNSHILLYGVIFAVSLLGLVKNSGRKEKRKI